MSVSSDRWTCPRCRQTTVANPAWQRDVAAAYARQVRDHHGPRCPGAPR